jgi:hypothetical protein
MAQRQEVLNVLLAQLLQERGVIAAPEQILKSKLDSVKLPDVLVDFQGLRLIVEAEFAGPGAQQAAYNSAAARVETGIAHIAIAVVYPRKLKTVGFARLKDDLASSRLQYLILNEVELSPEEVPTLIDRGIPHFGSGVVDDVVDSLNRSYERLIKDETLERAVARLEADIELFARAAMCKKGWLGRLAEALNVGQMDLDPHKGGVVKKQRNALIRVTALMMGNALIFQTVLAEKDSRVKSPDKLAPDEYHDPLLSELLEVWRFILKEINYYPIFHMASKLGRCLSDDQDLHKALRALIVTAKRIVQWRAALRHDLAGRIYHRLLEEAKYLGAYYTSVPAAQLLLKLALQPGRVKLDWSSPEAMKELRIADLACGTGTLLMAAADVVFDNYVRACARQGVSPKLEDVHRVLIEHVIHGYDVLDSAVHLTASTLALRVPEIPIDLTHLYTMPLGGREHALGSLEFLRKDETAGTLFSKPEQVLGKNNSQLVSVTIPRLDLCVMNPPFTRSVGGNLLFGNISDPLRERLQADLKKAVGAQSLKASITAGLGSVFVALATKYVKPSGRIALVLPRALVSGVAWKPTRDLIITEYELEYLIASHQPGRWNFSENTELSEVLVIAKRKTGGETESRDVTCINLWTRPSTAVEALNVASSVREEHIPDLVSGRGAGMVTIADRKAGEAFTVSIGTLGETSWGKAFSFAQTDLTRTFHHLLSGDLYLPRKGVCATLPMSPLRELAELGFDCRDMHDGFRAAKSKTVYPAFWNHDTSDVVTMGQAPNKWLEPLSRPAPKRPLRRAEHLWTKAGRLLVAERLWLNTARAAAVRVSEDVLSNVWWTVVLKALDITVSDSHARALALWLNSSLGFIVLTGVREETRGAWVKFKKPVLLGMPVLDPTQLKSKPLRKLTRAYDRLAGEPLLPLPQIDIDPTRAAIDHAIADALELPDFGILRELLAREPIISLDIDKLYGDSAAQSRATRRGPGS